MILETLKKETSGLHNQLHKVNIHERLLKGQLKRNEYERLIGIYHSFYSHSEVKYGAAVNKFEREAPVLDWLNMDAKSLNLKLSPKHFHAQSNQLCSFSSYLGYCYVKQGSTLGAKVLTQKLIKNPNIPNESINFFKGFGHQTDVNWTAFIRFVNDNHHRIELDAAITAALASFSSLLDMLVPISDEIKTLRDESAT